MMLAYSTLSLRCLWGVDAISMIHGTILPRCAFLCTCVAFLVLIFHARAALCGVWITVGGVPKALALIVCAFADWSTCLRCGAQVQGLFMSSLVAANWEKCVVCFTDSSVPIIYRVIVSSSCYRYWMAHRARLERTTAKPTPGCCSKGWLGCMHT